MLLLALNETALPTLRFPDVQLMIYLYSTYLKTNCILLKSPRKRVSVREKMMMMMMHSGLDDMTKRRMLQAKILSKEARGGEFRCSNQVWFEDTKLAYTFVIYGHRLTHLMGCILCIWTATMCDRRCNQTSKHIRPPPEDTQIPGVSGEAFY